MTPDLPTAETWYHREAIEPGVTRLYEQPVERLFRANLWHFRGRDRDLLVDGGMGVVALRPAFPDLFAARPVLAVASHTHVDHIGVLHEFADRAVHALEADELAEPAEATLVSAELDPGVHRMLRDAGFAPLPEFLIEALPHPWYDIHSFRSRPAPATRLLQEGDSIDLGDRVFQVVTLPGHSPGSVALWEADTGTLISGDIIYDGTLLYQGAGMDVGAYIDSFRRLRALPVRMVHPGHGGSFGRERMLAIIDAYLARWGAA